MIKSLRTKHHYSQEQLAQMSGLSLRTIQRVESGQSASLETLKSLAAVFEIDVDTLKGDITVIDKKSEEWALAPAWVRFGFWGIRDRRVAIRFESKYPSKSSCLVKPEAVEKLSALVAQFGICKVFHALECRLLTRHTFKRESLTVGKIRALI